MPNQKLNSLISATKRGYLKETFIFSTKNKLKVMDKLMWIRRIIHNFTLQQCLSEYSKTCHKLPLKKTPKLRFQYQLLLNACQKAGLEVIKLFSCSTQLSMKFQLLIKTKILTNKEVSCFKSLRCCIYHANNC